MLLVIFLSLRFRDRIKGGIKGPLGTEVNFGLIDRDLDEMPEEAALQTSYDLLTEERRRLWRLLAVFPETFDTKAAAVVWDLGAKHAARHLRKLERGSLVEWTETDGRYRLPDLARATDAHTAGCILTTPMETALATRARPRFRPRHACDR